MGSDLTATQMLMRPCEGTERSRLGFSEVTSRLTSTDQELGYSDAQRDHLLSVTDLLGWRWPNRPERR